MIEINSKNGIVKIFTDNIEESAMTQIIETANSVLGENSKIRVMPDVHAGKGCVIGFTRTIDKKVCPNEIGLDIGCGVLVASLKKGFHFDLEKLDKVIRKYVPSGQSIRTNGIHEYASRMYFDNLKCIDHVDLYRAINSIGTLGGGNHFIEVAIDDDGIEYLIIHSGSRNFGKQIAEYYQNIAYQERLSDNLSEKSIIADLKRQGRTNEIQSTLETLKLNKIHINKDLAFLTGENLKNYLNDIEIAQEYASINRSAIAVEIFSNIGIRPGDIEEGFTTVHNYIDIESMILRKGAVSAQEDEKLIIPINMRDGSLICRGKGNVDWNCSAPHGAGRLMSRSEAKKKISIDEYTEEMKDIYTTSVNLSTLDEAPMAYKNKEDIIKNISDTVEVVKIIKPIYNFKANT